MALQPVHVVVAYKLLLDPEHGQHYGPEIAELPEQERLVAMARFDADSSELLETVADSSNVLLVSLVEPVLTEDGEDPSEAEVRAAMAATSYLDDRLTELDREDALWDALRAARRVRVELLTEHTATLRRVRELVTRWQDTKEMGTDRQSIVAHAFGLRLEAVLDGESP